MENIKGLPVKISLVFGAHYNYKVSDLWASTYGHGTDIDIWAAHLLSDTTGSHMVCTPKAVLFTQSVDAWIYVGSQLFLATFMYGNL